MKKEAPLTPDQQKLVEQNLSLVKWVIYDSIHVNENVTGLGFEDLYQEGCLYLCRAAASYHTGEVKFPTYARKVVKNGLMDYCRSIGKRQKHLVLVETLCFGETVMGSYCIDAPCDEYMEWVSKLEIFALLESLKNNYQGIARKGIDALEMKIQGMTVTEIAGIYGVKPSLVGAWISRSKKKLKNDPQFLKAVS